MNPKIKKNLRRIIYLIIFSAMIFCFVYLGNKYASNSEVVKTDINDYYKNVNDEVFEVVKGREVVELLKSDGKNLIFIGNKNSEFSQKYIEELNTIATNLKVKKIYYYDLNNDLSQLNRNYYDIVKLLEGHLITTTGSDKNLLAPSFYIIVDGKVKYYNIETSAVKNTDTIESYWNTETEFNFIQEVSNAIENYYLNK